MDARLAGVRGQLVQEVVATLTSEPRLLLKELLLAIGEVSGFGWLGALLVS